MVNTSKTTSQSIKETKIEFLENQNGQLTLGGFPIMAQEQAFRNAGGKWLVYVPEVKVIP